MANNPSFYNPRNVGMLYKPDLVTVSRDAEAAKLPSAATDKDPIALFLVDFQIDFCHKDGSLMVPGAVEDLQRTIEFIYQNAHRIKTIVASLDSHTAFQIFYPTWWADANGQHPNPHTVITSDDITKGKFKPLREPAWSLDYVKKLETQASKPLYIWPYHTMLGNVGQALDPALYEAIHWHAVARKSQPIWLQKGMIPQTEHYSPFEPEVKVSNHPMGTLNTQVLSILEGHARVYIAGEAKSHCVLEACNSMVKHFAAKPEVIQRLFFLEDCTSSVQAPGIDFEAIAQAGLAEFKKKGMQFTTSASAF